MHKIFYYDNYLQLLYTKTPKMHFSFTLVKCMVIIIQQGSNYNYKNRILDVILLWVQIFKNFSYDGINHNFFIWKMLIQLTI